MMIMMMIMRMGVIMTHGLALNNVREEVGQNFICKITKRGCFCEMEFLQNYSEDSRIALRRSG